LTARFLGYGRQTIGEADIAAVVDALKSDFLTQGPAVERFERALAERVGARHAVAVCNGTAALHLACLAAGLGPGDRAGVADLTFVATANAPTYCGAEVTILDVNSDSRCLSPETVGDFKRHHGDARAVLPVHYGGLAQSSEALRRAAEGLVVIEDACHALGGTHENGEAVGGCAFSDMAAFSFHPVKPITTGEGGAVTTNDDELARRLRLLRNHGIERDPGRFAGSLPDEDGPWRYEQQALGFNYRMTDLQAALGVAQLNRLDSFLARRREIAAYYDGCFAGLDKVALPQSRPDQRARSGLHLYTIDVDFDRLGRRRSDVMAGLRDAGIGTQVHYIPVHRQPFHAARLSPAGGAFPVAEAHYARTLSIPFFPSMTDEEVEYVAKEIATQLT